MDLLRVTLRYSPKLLGDKSSSKWWLVADCSEEIGKYYRHLYYLYNNRCQQLLRPAWKEHITVIRDEEPIEAKKFLWKKYAGQSLNVLINSPPQTNGEYYWLQINSPDLLKIREELGLSAPFFPLHLSIGHIGLDI